MEVDVDHVVDVDASERLDRPHGQARAAQRVRRVQLRDAMTRDVDLEVARQRHERGCPLRGIEPHKDHRVRARAVLRIGTGAHVDGVLRALVGADQEDGLRLARGGRVDHLLDALDVGGVLERCDHLVHLVPRSHSGRARRGGNDHQRSDQLAE